MTITNMDEQQRHIVNKALDLFSNAFFVRGISGTPLMLGYLATLLYLLDKNCVDKKCNVTMDEEYIISSKDIYFVQKNDLQLYEDWKQKGIYNEAILVLLSKDDPMAQTNYKNILFLERHFKNNPLLFEFIDLISQYKNGYLYFLEVFDIAIKRKSDLGLGHIFIQPEAFLQLGNRILDAKGKTVFNPFSGIQSFATSLEGYVQFTSLELDHFRWEIGQYRIWLAHKERKITSLQGGLAQWPTNKYDIVVSVPPIGMLFNSEEKKRSIKSEWFCIDNFEELTTEQGVLLTYVIPSVLFDRTNRYYSIRKNITENNYLDAVIQLPFNLLRPYTSIALVAIILKKNRQLDAPIKMLDASNLFLGNKRDAILDVETVIEEYNNMSSENSVLVLQNDIRHNEYDWSVSRYIHMNDETFPEGYQIVKLGEVVDFIKGEKSFSEKRGHVARISQLSGEGADCITPVDSFEESNDLTKTTKITEPVIIMSSVRDLKPSYCEASPENPIFMHQNVFACRVKKEWVSPTYLCLELSRRFFQTSGSVIPRISPSIIKGVNIAFPSINQINSLKEQNNLYQEAADSLKLAKAKELGLQSYIEKLKKDYINIVRTRKHDMMPYMRELASVSRSLRKYIEKYGSAELQEKIESLLKHFETAYNGLSALVEVFSQEEEFGKPEKLNIDQYFIDFVNRHDEMHSGYSVDYYCDDNALVEYGLPAHKVKKKEFSLFNGLLSVKAEIAKINDIAPLFISIAPLDLDRVIHNIINNAQEHGFTDSNVIDYHININLTVDAERKMFQIDFSNNGTPLPAGMDKVRYGMLGEKAGRTGKTGKGGFIVKSIIEHYHGDYDVFTQGQNTIIRICLPILNDNE